MKKRSILLGLAALTFIAAGIMLAIGLTSSHMSELAEFSWTPIPLGVILLIAGLKTK